MIYTSYYGNLKNLQGKRLVSVSQGYPKTIELEQCNFLKPTWDIIMKTKSGEMTSEEYNVKYNKQLNNTNLNKLKTLYENYEGDIVLLCWEKDWNDCHRKNISDWLNKNGIKCEEFNNSKGKTLIPLQVLGCMPSKTGLNWEEILSGRK